MGFWEAIVFITAIIGAASVIKARYGVSRHREGHDYHLGSNEQRRLQDEVRQLKERIVVLERITTDRESSLEREIERLRDH